MSSDSANLKRSPVESFQETQKKYSRWSGLVAPDKVLMICIALLMLIGLVMVTSSSLPFAAQRGEWIYIYPVKQMIYMTVGLFIAGIIYLVPMQTWYDGAPLLLCLAFVCLIAVLIPGVGTEVNGSMRWIRLGPIQVQVSEFVRISVFIYAAAYLQRHQNQIHKSLKPLLVLLFVLGCVSILLLKEPDFGSTAVICATVFGMVYLAGVCTFRFILCAVIGIVVAGFLVWAAPYRRQRLSTFIDPWQDMFGDGYQLVNSLIAIGRGEVTGVGIGESIEKHQYLPEAHTDFIFSIIAEETGLIGVCVLIALYVTVVWRVFVIANNADKVRMRFSSCLAYGIGLWFGMQAIINLAVSSGILPTKGLTLPLISYGGSSVLATMVLFAILLRIDSESRYTLNNERKRRGAVKI